jgi:hypothetical protein
MATPNNSAVMEAMARIMERSQDAQKMSHRQWHLVKVNRPWDGHLKPANRTIRGLEVPASRAICAGLDEQQPALYIISR